MHYVLGVTVFSQNLGWHVRFFNDDYDRVIYSQRGAWALDGLVPYRGVFSESPARGDLRSRGAVPRRQRRLSSLSAVFSLVMCFFLGATIELLRRMLPGREWLAS